VRTRSTRWTHRELLQLGRLLFFSDLSRKCGFLQSNVATLLLLVNIDINISTEALPVDKLEVKSVLLN
jgi:hypothetical protein